MLHSEDKEPSDIKSGFAFELRREISEGKINRGC